MIVGGVALIVIQRNKIGIHDAKIMDVDIIVEQRLTVLLHVRLDVLGVFASESLHLQIVEPHFAQAFQRLVVILRFGRIAVLENGNQIGNAQLHR